MRQRHHSQNWNWKSEELKIIQSFVAEGGGGWRGMDGSLFLLFSEKK